MLQSLLLSFRIFLNYFKIYSRSKVSAGQSWMVFGVPPAVIQNYRAKRTKKWPKMAQIESNMAFMSPNPLDYVLICITLHHRVIKYVFLLHLLIFGQFMLRFCRKSAFFWKIAIISASFFSRFSVCARARAQDISVNIDPIDLKFGGMILYGICNKCTWGIRVQLIFSYFFNSSNNPRGGLFSAKI